MTTLYRVRKARAVSTTERKCKTCGRRIEAGEPYTYYTARASQWKHYLCNVCEPQ